MYCSLNAVPRIRNPGVNGEMKGGKKKTSRALTFTHKHIFKDSISAIIDDKPLLLEN